MSISNHAAILQQARNSVFCQNLSTQASVKPVTHTPLSHSSESVAALLSVIGIVPGHQERPAQLEMAALIEYALQQEKHAMIEAATGTGKGKGYGVPSVLSGKKIVVSTGNKALQAQLVEKDMPWIAEHIRPFTFAIMKGEANYLCLDRLQKFGEEEAGDPVEDEAYRQLVELANDEAFDGDFENKVLDFVPPRVKSQVHRDGDMCAGKKCNFYDRCPYYRMRNAAEAAQMLIVNHSLLAINAAKGGKVLPVFDAAIVDEAHRLEEFAIEAFTITIAPTRITSLLKHKTLKAHTAEDRRQAILQQMSCTWQELDRRFFADTTKGEQKRVELGGPVEEGLTLASMLQGLVDEFEANKPDLSGKPKENELYNRFIRRAGNLTDDLRQVFAVKDSKHVYCLEWAGNDEKKRFIKVSRIPLDVASLLKKTLFDKTPVIATSATLATSIEPRTAFNYFKSRVGLDGKSAVEKVLPTVFDYASNTLLYIPRDIPVPPKRKGLDPAAYKKLQGQYEQAIIERMILLVQASRGRAFLLFCSNDMKQKAYTRFLDANLPYPLLYQEEGISREKLTQQFRNAGNAVLFGVKTFWEGIDIPGDALSLVVIDKLPFSPPDDPVQKTRVEQMKAAGEDWWNGYVIPQVVLQLKQGVGRLIRTDTDRGVMAILDARLHMHNYGHILPALPLAQRHEKIQEVERFFREEKVS